MKNGPTWLTILRDVVCITLGGAGLGRMMFTGIVDHILLAVCLILLGVVPAANVLPLLRLLGEQQQQSSASTSSSKDSPSS